LIFLFDKDNQHQTKYCLYQQIVSLSLSKAGYWRKIPASTRLCVAATAEQGKLSLTAF
jgi:hypothetical protein